MFHQGEILQQRGVQVVHSVSPQVVEARREGSNVRSQLLLRVRVEARGVKGPADVASIQLDIASQINEVPPSNYRAGLNRVDGVHDPTADRKVQPPIGTTQQAFALAKR